MIPLRLRQDMRLDRLPRGCKFALVQMIFIRAKKIFFNDPITFIVTNIRQEGDFSRLHCRLDAEFAHCHDQAGHADAHAAAGHKLH